jgi:hypothetical protein
MAPYWLALIDANWQNNLSSPYFNANTVHGNGFLPLSTMLLLFCFFSATLVAVLHFIG